jgi:hypothetical protein
MAKATGCEDTESSFPARDTEQRKLAHISLVSDTRGEFSVFSQAVRSFTTACYGPALQPPPSTLYKVTSLVSRTSCVTGVGRSACAAAQTASRCAATHAWTTGFRPIS